MRPRTLLPALAAALALALAAPAQTPAPNQAAVPISDAPLHVQLPRTVVATLPNGLTVLMLENHRLPTVTVYLDLRDAGGFGEPADQPGLANFTAEMMSLGTTSRTSAQIADQAAALGAVINVGAAYGLRSATLTARGLSNNFPQWFALAADILLHPSFPADEWIKLRQQAEVGLRQQRANPGFLANERFDKAVYGDFPAGVDTTTVEALQAMTPAAFAAWHAQRYVPQNAVLAIAGDIQPQALLAQLGTALGAWQRTDRTVPAPGLPTAPGGRKIFLIDRPGSVQTTLTMGNISIVRTSPDYPVWVVLNEILGSQPEGRLFVDLREKQSLAYNVGSGFNAYEFPGEWSAGGSFRTAVTGQAMSALLAQITALRTTPVPADELQRARQSVVARFALSLESPPAVVNDWLVAQLYGLPAGYWDGYPASIMAVTSADIQRVAQQYFDPAQLQIVAVGDAAAIQPVLAQYGAVQLYGMDGKPKS